MAGPKTLLLLFLFFLKALLLIHLIPGSVSSVGVGLRLVGEGDTISISSNCDLIAMLFCFLVFQGLCIVKKPPAFFLVRIDFEVPTRSGEMIPHTEELGGRLALRSISGAGPMSSSWLELLLPLPPDTIPPF